MSKFKFKLNRSGVAQLLKSSEMQNVLSKKAGEISGRAGDGFEAETYVGRDRARATVKADTPEAYRECLKNNSLLKALR